MSKNIIQEKITDIFIFLIIIIFPLLVDKTGFFHILECKYRCFLCISIAYILSITIISIFQLINGKKVFYKPFGKKQILIVSFILINIISFLFSPFLKDYNLFLGVGRGEGLITSVLYPLSFLYISYFGKFKKRCLLYFSISSILINTIAILQYVGFNPFNMYQEGIGTHNVSFMATIGNVDFISALYTIILTVSFGSYVFLNSIKKENIIHLLSLLLGSFIFMIIDVNSGKLAFLTVLVLIFPFILNNNVRLSKALKALAVVLLSITINMFINIEYHYDISKLGFYFKVDFILIVYIILILILLLLSRIIKKNSYDLTDNKRIYKIYYIFLIIISFGAVLFIYIFPFKSGFLYEIHEILHLNFSDEFGTYRLFLWKRTIPLIKDYPLLGSGPDTFALRFMPLYSEDIASIGEFTINDTAANIYLTMIINIGLLGLIIYLMLLISLLIMGIKNINKNSIPLLLSVICYMIQSFFNLSVVIVSPVFWCLLGIYYICIEKESLYIKKEKIQ